MNDRLTFVYPISDMNTRIITTRAAGERKFQHIRKDSKSESSAVALGGAAECAFINPVLSATCDRGSRVCKP